MSDRKIVEVPDFDRWTEYLGHEWDQLTPQEKSICLSYVRAMNMKKKINGNIVLEVNKIHDRHPHFHLGHMPITKDLSGYLPEEAR